jgi:hypothetical protein
MSFSSVREIAQEISKGLKPPPKERQAPDPSVALSLGLTCNLDDLTTYASIASILLPLSNHIPHDTHDTIESISQSTTLPNTGSTAFRASDRLRGKVT